MTIQFHGNPQTTIISCYSPTNVSDEIETEDFYTDLTAITRQVHLRHAYRHVYKHNLLLIAGDFNDYLGQDDGFKYSFHETSNLNGIMLKHFLHAHKLICLNTQYQKRSGQTWTHTSPNNFKSQINFIIINSNWKNSAKNARAYNSFISLVSDHRIVSANIELSLRKNIKKVSKTKLYDWSSLKYDAKIKNTFITEVKNIYSALTLQEEYNNIIIC